MSWFSDHSCFNHLNRCWFSHFSWVSAFPFQLGYFALSEFMHTYNSCPLKWDVTSSTSLLVGQWKKNVSYVFFCIVYIFIINDAAIHSYTTKFGTSANRIRSSSKQATAHRSIYVYSSIFLVYLLIFCFVCYRPTSQRGHHHKTNRPKERLLLIQLISLSLWIISKGEFVAEKKNKRQVLLPSSSSKKWTNNNFRKDITTTNAKQTALLLSQRGLCACVSMVMSHTQESVCSVANLHETWQVWCSFHNNHSLLLLLLLSKLLLLLLFNIQW